MDRFSTQKAVLSAGLTAVFTACAQRLMDALHITNAWETGAAFVFAPVAAALLTGAVFQLAVKSRFGRRLLFGRAWVEGWWHIVTYEGTQLSTEVQPGLMHVEYSGPDLTPSTVTYRLMTGGSVALPLSSRSTSSSVRDYDLLLINYCTFPSENTEGKALGIGNFLLDGKSYPTRYEGYLLRLNDGIYRRQAAVKISENQVAAAKRADEHGWINHLLVSLSAPLAPPALRPDSQRPPEAVPVPPPAAN